MKIPNKVKIGGREYKIEFQKSTDIIENNCGRNSRVKGLIAIDDDIMQTEKEYTFFHEVIHLINGEIEEVECEYLAGAIYVFLTDNKLLK